MKAAGLAMLVVKLFCVVRKAGDAGIRLAEDAEQGLRSVDPLLRASRPVEERVADAVSGANHGLRVDAVRQAEPRAVVFVVGMNQARLNRLPLVALTMVLVVGSKFE